MLAQNDSLDPGTHKSRKLITAIGMVIGVAWLVVGILTMTKLVSWQEISAYALDSRKGWFLLQLVGYSFINGSDAFWLIFILSWLAGLVNVSRQCLTPAGFMRIYSLGTVGSGLIYLLISQWVGAERKILPGGELVLITMHGALAVLVPRSKLFESSVSSTPGIAGGYLSVWKVNLKKILWGSFLIAFLIDLYRLSLGHVFSIAFVVWVMTRFMIRVRLVKFAVIWLAFILVITSLNAPSVKIMMLNQHTFLLSNMAGLIIGVLYGCAETLWDKHGIKLQKA